MNWEEGAKGTNSLMSVWEEENIVIAVDEVICEMIGIVQIVLDVCKKKNLMEKC